MERLTPEQIERLKQTNPKHYYEYANYFYVHDIDYYKQYFEQDIKNRKELDKKSDRNNTIIKLSAVAVIVIAMFFFCVYSVMFDKSGGKNNQDSGDDSERVENSSYDGSVRQCKVYLMSRLKDPDSYESIEWSKVVRNDKGYLVRHKYRAKNSFGGYNINNVIFHLNNNGKVTEMLSIE